MAKAALSRRSGTALMPSQLDFLAPTVCEDLVRLGRRNDGGYVIPKRILTEADFLLSLGVNDDWSFDADFQSRNPRLKIHAYDHTISKKVFEKKIVHSFIRLFLRKSTIKEVISGINSLRSYRDFFRGDVRHVPQRVHNRRDTDQDVTIATIFERIDSARVFLKMDIEGSEYRIIDDLLNYSSRMVGMVIEFHDTDPFRAVFCNAVQKIQQCFEIVHIHGNNLCPVAADGLPELLEITFLRKEFCGRAAKRFDLPIKGLDEPNDPSKADYNLVFG